MITGFNTDIKHGGVTYHVQTEDKGLDSPLILSLVYVGGAIIASKRTPYEDLVGGGFDEQVLTERLQRQHKLICAAIKAGRVGDLKRMGAQNGAARPEAESREKSEAAPERDDDAHGVSKADGAKHGGRRKKPEPPPPVEAEPSVEPAPPVEPAPSTENAPAYAAVPPDGAAQTVVTSPVEAAPPVEKAPSVETTRAAEEPSPIVHAGPPPSLPAAPPVPPKAEAPRESPVAPPAPRAEPEIVILTTLAEEVSALGDLLYRPEHESPVPAGPVLPVGAEAQTAEAEAIPVTPLVEAEIIEEPFDTTDELYVQLLDDEGDFRAGQFATVKAYVGRGAYGFRPVLDASVTVKVLGTSFRPIILTAETDDDGVAVVRVLLPRFNAGRAAIIIRATDGEDVAELRRIIRQ